MKKSAWIALGVAVVFVFIGVRIFNKIVRFDQNVKESWAQVENVLQRRYDLIPNLVETVKGYAAHEQAVFTQVTEARAKVGQAGTLPEKVAAQEGLTAALGRLMLVVENYPDLKANQNFLALQDELAGTENRISVERRRYNEEVNHYNSYVRQFPGRFFVGIGGFDKNQPFFKSEEGAKEAPKVKF